MTTSPAAAYGASQLQLAPAREPEAAPVETRRIAAWVNEGGAGGEANR